MIALLGSALGFGTSFLPQVLGFFQKRQDHKNRIEESSGFAAGLSASVRPVITYLFFGVFLAVKAVILLKAMEAGGDWKDAVPLMFDTETQALFSAIIAFWFGQRSVNKFMRANK